MEIKHKPQLLLVAGTGRNTGKTTFICTIIRRFSTRHSIVALKITPHFHLNVQSGEVVINREDVYIARETNADNGKDSSLMLQSGAIQSYFIMAKDEHLGEALKQMEKLLPAGSLIICESGGLRDLVHPGLFFMMQKEGEETTKPKASSLKLLADRVITFNGSAFDFDADTIEITNYQWTLKTTSP